jgi:glycine cleavage system H protein
MGYHKGNYYFTEEHEWIRFENNYAFIGMTAMAKRELGIITNIEIHTTGKILTENQVFGTITTEKYLCKLIMPLRGKIVEANVINYEKFNTMDEDFDPDEWIVKITISHPLISKKLYTLKDYMSNNNGRELHLVKYFLKFNQ